MTKLIDFHFEGGGRSQALVALRRLYPSYSTLRFSLKALNALNQIGPKMRPRSLRQLDHDHCRMPELASGESRTYLLHKIEQTGRVYLFDEDRRGQLSSVTKLALNAKSAAGINREARVLEKLAGRTELGIPKVLELKSWRDGCFMRISATRVGFSTHRKSQILPDAVFDAISALRSDTCPKAVGVADFESWQFARERASTAGIRAISNEIGASDQFEAAAVHGDLGSENVFSRGNAQQISDFAIIDWEFFSETAPALSDRVGFWLGRNHRALKGRFGARPEVLARAFLADFETAPGGRRAAVFALLYLAGTGIDLARKLAGDKT